MTARWEHFKDLAFEALQLGPDARSRFLDAACGDDAALRAEVDALLSAGAEVRGDFLESPPAGVHDADLQRQFGVHVPAAGEIIAQRYRLIRELGEGGMGQVWLAEQTTPVQRTVALKFIKAGMYDEAVVQRFASERQSLAIMDHPAIAKVFDAGATTQGQPYFIMEYVPGPSITDYCDQHKVGIRGRLELLIQACEGVQHAHQKAVMHRDLKPANILVVEVDGKPVPKIIDFGLAKAATPRHQGDTRRAQYSQFFGTPGYISPEQLDPGVQDIDTRTDVYSLGVILYVLVTGLQPFESTRRQKPPLDELLRRLREEDPVSPSGKLVADRDSATAAAAARGTEPKALIRELRGDLDWIAVKALERDRERRYATPSELAADLRRYLKYEPVLARPASAAYQIRKFIRRHRLTTAGAVLVTLLAMVAFASAVVAVRQKHEAEYHAKQALQAQARLLTQAAAQRLKDSDLAGAQGIILEVLTNPAFMQSHTAAAISVFQDVRAADPQLAVLSGHAGRVHFAQYSPDGARIVTASEDKTVRVWDADTGVQRAVLLGHDGQVFTVAYSSDGSRLVTASSDKTVRVWDAVTGVQMKALSAPGLRPIAAAFSPDGIRVVAASLDNTARIFDARSGVQITVLSGHEDRLQSVTYSPDGSQILTASVDKTARIWAPGTGAPLGVLVGHTGMVLRANYSPDGTRVVTASADKTARVWDVRTGKQLAVLSGHEDRVYSASYSPDGTRIVTASDDGTARIWDARSGAPLAVLSGHGGFVRSAEFSADGSRVVTASNDKTARIWVVRQEVQIASLLGHRDGVAFAAYSRDGVHIVTASLDRSARIWDAGSGAPLTTLTGVDDFVITAVYSSDGTRIITGGSADNTARIWDANSGAPLAALRGHGGIVESAVYSPDGGHIATASLDNTARIWDARTGAQLAVLSGHGGPVLSAAFSPDGRHLTTASFDKTARIWDANTGEQQGVLSGHSQIVSDSVYSPDGKQLVTASFDKTARTWDALTREPLLVLAGHAGPVQSAGYSPDGAHIVTSSLDKTARIWDAKTGAQLAVLSGHQDAVQFAAYSPDGNHIVTASLDKTARIWDARVPADLDAQILWDEAAQTDPLTPQDRSALALPPPAGMREWSEASACDKAAAAVYDPDRLAPGSLSDGIVVDVAITACAAEIKPPRHAARSDYQMGRALIAKGDPNGARRRFELAASGGSRAAQIDLADLLANPTVTGFDLGRARSLYERAWQDGVPIAAFRLGTLYEHGPQGASGTVNAAFHPDVSQAWRWYQKGADAGEPNALARFAESSENTALGVKNPRKRNALLLRAFSRYAAAAMHAYRENWPDDAWKHWRYRRASLARVLAADGMMQPVADAFAGTLNR